MRVCLGGTFDILHPGHEALLAKAFEVGDEVFIGLTSDRLARKSRARKVRSFRERRRTLEALLRKRNWKGIVSEIDHPFGRALERRYQGIVVSPETLPRVASINQERLALGLKPLRIFTIPYLYAQDGLRFSATRIARKEISRTGRRLTPLRVAVGTENVIKVQAVETAFRQAFPAVSVRVRKIRVPSGVPQQPTQAETLRGSFLRAERALQKWPDADYGVGIEAGLMRNDFLGRHLDVQYVTVQDRMGARSSSHGGGFYYPRDVEKKILRGQTVSSVLGPMAKDARLGSTTGAVGFLTRGALDREELTRHAVLLALVPRIRRDLYQE